MKEPNLPEPRYSELWIKYEAGEPVSVHTKITREDLGVFVRYYRAEREPGPQLEQRRESGAK